MDEAPNFTERQARYFAAMRASLQSATGRSLDEWVAIARTCPETGHRARLNWFKTQHGLLQNRASYVIDQTFGSTRPWSKPDTLIDSLWSNPRARLIYEAIDAAALALPETVRTARKGYTAWSRTFQFAAARPIQDGGAMLGLALLPDTERGLEAPKSESWSERLKSRLRTPRPEFVDDAVAALLRSAWERS